jgi:hypothetical protein
MPVITRTNNLYRIKDLRIDRDTKGYYLTMNSGKSIACVICISSHGPVAMEALQLSEAELITLVNGGNLSFPKGGYTLQGVTRPQLAAAPQFRNFQITPPCYVQVWGMSNSDTGSITLHMPASPEEQQVLVPVDYRADWDGSSLTVWIQSSEGYRDGDLMYQVGGHYPIPIPGPYLNQPIRMRPGAEPVVQPAPEAGKKYRAV